MSKDHLYFVESPKNRLIKIGRAAKPAERLAILLIGSPDPGLHMLAVFHGEGDREKDWHAHFADLRSHGEWFRAAKELKDAISQHGDSPDILAKRKASHRVPKYRKRRDRNSAYIEYCGKRYALPGKYNSGESLQAYHRFLAKIMPGRIHASRLTVPADERMLALLNKISGQLDTILQVLQNNSATDEPKAEEDTVIE